MITDTIITAAPDMVHYLAQGQTITFDTNQLSGSGAPQINIIFTPEIKQMVQKIGIFMLIVWGVLIAWAFANPKNAKGGEGGGLRKAGGVLGILLALATLAMIISPENFVKFVNILIKLGHMVISFIFSIF